MLKVAILGTAAGWEGAPFEDESYELWGLNDLYDKLSPYELSRITRWFELHGDTPITRTRRTPEHWDRLAALDIPVYTFHDIPGVKYSRLFPVEQAVAAGREYFACTNAYQIALALSEGATHIELYGIVLATAREALVERPCVEWWLGLAEGRGVTVKVAHPWNYGLGRHLYRYALDDAEERYDTYAWVYAFHDGVFHWLIEETKRLNLTPDPIGEAVPGA